MVSSEASPDWNGGGAGVRSVKGSRVGLEGQVSLNDPTAAPMEAEHGDL